MNNLSPIYIYIYKDLTLKAFLIRKMQCSMYKNVEKYHNILTIK